MITLGLLCATVALAAAETLVERGGYLPDSRDGKCHFRRVLL